MELITGTEGIWATTETTENIGFINGQVSCYSVKKLQGDALYPVEAVIFKWGKEDAVDLKVMTKGLRLVDSWQTEDYMVRVYLHKNAYANKDTINQVKRNLNAMGLVWDKFLGWIVPNSYFQTTKTQVQWG